MLPALPLYCPLFSRLARLAHLSWPSIALTYLITCLTSRGSSMASHSSTSLARSRLPVAYPPLQPLHQKLSYNTYNSHVPSKKAVLPPQWRNISSYMPVARKIKRDTNSTCMAITYCSSLRCRRVGLELLFLCRCPGLSIILLTDWIKYSQIILVLPLRRGYRIIHDHIYN